MNHTALAQRVDILRELLDPAPRQCTPASDGARLRALGELGTAFLQQLREEMAACDDPRLALELAGIAESLGHESTRLRILAADRLAASNAHLMQAEEFDALRQNPPETNTPATFCTGRPLFGTPAQLLASWVGIPLASARRRVADAADLIARRDATGTLLPPRFTHLAALFADPQQNPDPVLETSAKIAKHEPPDTSFDGEPTAPTLRHHDGRAIEEHAAQVLSTATSVPEARRHINELVATAADDPETSDPVALRRGLFRLPERSTLTREYLLRVSTLEAERLESFLAHANNPRTKAGQAARRNPNPGTEAGTNPTATDAATADFLPEGAEAQRWEDEPAAEATVAERGLNALLALLTFDHRSQRATGDPQTVTGQQLTITSQVPRLLLPGDSGANYPAIRPEVIVHLRIEDLRDLAAGDARTAHGAKLPPGQLRQLLCDANLLPAIFNGRGELLDYGRAQRIVPDKLKRAVLARDRGCLVPGCTEPPERLEFHHIDPWHKGGRTCLSNLGPGCLGHHLDYDSGRIKLVFRDGLPWVILPPHLDPEQKPRRNTYWDDLAA
ncbi:HNH endonuclease signature motif containing protein [Glutamicibacter sp. X7]